MTLAYGWIDNVHSTMAPIDTARSWLPKGERKTTWFELVDTDQAKFVAGGGPQVLETPRKNTNHPEAVFSRHRKRGSNQPTFGGVNRK